MKLGVGDMNINREANYTFSSLFHFTYPSAGTSLYQQGLLAALPIIGLDSPHIKVLLNQIKAAFRENN